MLLAVAVGGWIVAVSLAVGIVEAMPLHPASAIAVNKITMREFIGCFREAGGRWILPPIQASNWIVQAGFTG
jgi:hypothetical protein